MIQKTVRRIWFEGLFPEFDTIMRTIVAGEDFPAHSSDGAASLHRDFRKNPQTSVGGLFNYDSIKLPPSSGEGGNRFAGGRKRS